MPIKLFCIPALKYRKQAIVTFVLLMYYITGISYASSEAIPRKIDDKGYYAVIQRNPLLVSNGGHGAGATFIKMIYYSPVFSIGNVKREGLYTDVLYISGDKKITAVFVDEERTICSYYDESKYNHTAATKCSSLFTNSGLDASFLFGAKNYYVSIDQDKIENIANETHLIENVLAFQLELYRSEFAQAITIKKIEEFINKYYSYDPDQLVIKAKKKLTLVRSEEDIQQRTIWVAQYRNAFDNIQSVSELRDFINNYTNDDPDRLVQKVKQKLVKAEVEEEKNNQLEQGRMQREAERVQKDAERKSVRLNAWRKSLKIGDDTFCGPVIDVRYPMIKIAVIAQLQGYASEAWLKSEQIFPPNQGCQNLNGHLSPN